MTTKYVLEEIEKIDKNISNIYKELEIGVEATKIDGTKYPFPILSYREWKAFIRVVKGNLVDINRHLNRIENSLPTINLSKRDTLQRYAELAESMVMLNNQDEKDEFLTQLYMVLHIANGDCRNPHSDWKKEIEPLFELYNI